MAYAAKSLHRMASAAFAAGETKSVYAYATNDTLAQVAASGYFNSATSRLRKGDIIEVLATVSGTPTTGRVVVTSATGAATVTTALVGDVAAGVAGTAAGFKIARGQHTTATATDTVATGLATVVAALVVADDDPVDAAQHYTADIGDQAGSPAAGSIIIKGWKMTAANDATLIAASTFAKKVNWIAIGI